MKYHVMMITVLNRLIFYVEESKMKQLIMIGILIISLTGCVPKMHTVSPQIEGRVVDVKTGKPLTHVAVGKTYTNDNGKFIINAKKVMGVATPMGGMWRLPTIVVPVFKKGYIHTACRCSGMSNSIYGCSNVTIALTPKEYTNFKPIIQSTHSDTFSCQNIRRGK